MQKKKKLINYVTLALFIIIVLFLVLKGGLVEQQKMEGKKVLLIGIDGFDPKIASKLMDEGKLPNFKKLAETGTFINLNTSYPPHSPVAWTSIATGTNPGKHNIFDFIRRNPENYLPELSLAKSVSGIAGTDYASYVKSDPFWRITTKEGIPTTVIRWPVSFPPERVEGNLLAGLGVPDIKGLLSGYTYYTTKDIKESNKVVKVNEEEGAITTKIIGPKTRKSGSLINVEVPMQIIQSKNSVELIIQDQPYKIELNSWSDWIRAKFKVGLLRNVQGIFKAYLVNLEPFEMYITTIQIDPEKPVVKISYPDKYSADLAGEIGLYYTLGMPEETDGLVDGRISDGAFLEQINQIEEERTKMFWHEFENFKNIEKGVYAFVYDASDRVQHVFWEEKLLEKDDGVLSLNLAVVDYFAEKDKFIGEVIEKIDENTALIIVSDHGFTSFERAVSINTWFVENGFMTLTKELKEGEEGALFKYVDWSKTKAYAVGFNSIYINLKGREGKGIVEDAEKEKVISEIIEKLESLKDEKTGKKVMNKVYKTSELFKGDFLGEAPDLIAGFNPGFRMAWETAIGGFTKEIIYDNTKKWDGDHLVDPLFVPGVLFSNIKFDADSASQMDVAPTVLDFLGVEIPENIDGKSLIG